MRLRNTASANTHRDDLSDVHDLLCSRQIYDVMSTKNQLEISRVCPPGVAPVECVLRHGFNNDDIIQFFIQGNKNCLHDTFGTSSRKISFQFN